jgi:hypothetical protein
MIILRVLFVLCIAITLANRSEAAGQMSDDDSINKKIFQLSISNGELIASSNIVQVTQGTELTLVIKSDKPLTLHLHGYDIIRKIVPNSLAFLVIDTFATGRFPIKVHGHEDGGQGNTDHERTLVYLEVHPD